MNSDDWISGFGVNVIDSVCDSIAHSIQHSIIKTNEKLRAQEALCCAGPKKAILVWNELTRFGVVSLVKTKLESEQHFIIMSVRTLYLHILKS